MMAGSCPKCGERWQPGDLICGTDAHLPYEQRRRPTVWQHYTCPVSDPESAEFAVGAAAPILAGHDVPATVDLISAFMPSVIRAKATEGAGGR